MLTELRGLIALIHDAWCNRNTPANHEDYALKVDTQAEKFVETKQKLTYFLITASVAVLAFIIHFTAEHRGEIQGNELIVVLCAVSGLITAGMALLNLHLETRSYGLHLKYRYSRLEYDQLPAAEQQQWTRTNTWASRFLRAAFIALFAEIAFGVTLLILYLSSAPSSHGIPL